MYPRCTMSRIYPELFRCMMYLHCHLHVSVFDVLRIVEMRVQADFQWLSLRSLLWSTTGASIPGRRTEPGTVMHCATSQIFTIWDDLGHWRTMEEQRLECLAKSCKLQCNCSTWLGLTRHYSFTTLCFTTVLSFVLEFLSAFNSSLSGRTCTRMWNGSSERRRDSRRQEMPRDAKRRQECFKTEFRFSLDLFHSLYSLNVFESLYIFGFSTRFATDIDWAFLPFLKCHQMSADVRFQAGEPRALQPVQAGDMQSHSVHIEFTSWWGISAELGFGGKKIVRGFWGVYVHSCSFIGARLDKLIARLLCFSMFFWFASVNHRDPMTALFDFQLSLWHILTQMQMQLGGLLDMFGDHHAGAV